MVLGEQLPIVLSLPCFRRGLCHIHVMQTRQNRFASPLPHSSHSHEARGSLQSGSFEMPPSVEMKVATCVHAHPTLHALGARTRDTCRTKAVLQSHQILCEGLPCVRLNPQREAGHLLAQTLQLLLENGRRRGLGRQGSSGSKRQSGSRFKHIIHKA